MNPSEHTMTTSDEIELLLPWYVTGRLDAGDTARVEAHLAADEGMRERLDLMVKERNETVHLNDAELSRPVTTPDRFVAEFISGQDDRKAGLWSRLKQLMTAPTPGAVSWAGAAAALVILAQGAAIFMLAQPDPVRGYREADGVSQAAADGTFALVRFADTASASDIAALLTELNMKITEGPRAGRLFKVRLGAAGLSHSVRQRRLAALSARADLVVFAAETR